MFTSNSNCNSLLKNLLLLILLLEVYLLYDNNNKYCISCSHECMINYVSHSNRNKQKIVPS